VAAIVPPTALVEIMKVALIEPLGTVTLAGTVTGSPPDNATAAPPAGAAAVRVAVPLTEFPPTTLDEPNEIEASATDPAATVSAGDWRLLPPSDAVIVAVPAATAAIVNVALEEPAGIMRGVCTVATAGLLLDSEILAPPVGAAAVRLTVPCPLVPAITLIGLSATPDTAGLVVVGMAGEPEPHRIIATAATTVVASVMIGVGRRLILGGSSLSATEPE
jgi:hypothetical protein